VAGVEACLRRLDTDFVDIFHVHGVQIEDYDYACSELVPVLVDMKSEGKIRFLGITEAFSPDPNHKTLQRAVQDDVWEVMMVGFNILNQSARETVLPSTQAKGIGTLCMFAVRRALSQPEALRELLQQLLDQNLIADVDPDTALNFLTAKDVAHTLQEAAYRFCRHEPGIDVVLSGTGNLHHLEANVDSILKPALPPEVVAKLQAMFEGIDSISGN
jgi:aryl-alcohol dehydrogenase-like predicted oxidoreductase